MRRYCRFSGALLGHHRCQPLGQPSSACGRFAEASAFLAAPEFGSAHRWEMACDLGGAIRVGPAVPTRSFEQVTQRRGGFFGVRHVGEMRESRVRSCHPGRSLAIAA